MRTWGISFEGWATANNAYPLSDGAILVLTEAVMADRNGHVYGGQIYPEQLTGGGDGSLDPATDYRSLVQITMTPQ